MYESRLEVKLSLILQKWNSFFNYRFCSTCLTLSREATMVTVFLWDPHRQVWSI